MKRTPPKRRAAATCPHYAYIKRVNRTGPDSYEYYNEHRIVWATIGDKALTSLLHGSDLRVVYKGILQPETTPPDLNGIDES